MNKVIIQEPIWKDRTVSIAKHKIGSDGCYIEIAYKDKIGNRVFPHTYFLTPDIIVSAKSVNAGGTPCYNVKISDLTIIGDKDANSEVVAESGRPEEPKKEVNKAGRKVSQEAQPELFTLPTQHDRQS